MSEVVIVDDEEAICWGLSRLLGDMGHVVRAFSNAEEAIEQVTRRAPDLIVLDVRLPGMDGLSAMARLRQLAPDAPIVVITAFGSLATAVEAVRNGAFDYLAKPFDLAQATATLERALASRDDAVREPGSSQAEQLGTSETSEEGTKSADELLGSSPAMQQIFKRIALVAPTDAAVLITGESGTGKELVARAVHRHSRLCDRTLVSVHLAALNPTLVESELFGHVRGAFTGADADRKGLLELADGGTVFLDEVGDVPLQTQVKLLRALERREVHPVGDARPRRAEFRLICATHRNLRQEIAQGNFREDLYFRLAVFEIQLPALRERGTDIALLAESFLRSLNLASGRALSFTDAARAEMQRRPWPGNVRELRNAVECAALSARQGWIGPEHFPAQFHGVTPSSPTASVLDAAVRRWTRERLAADPPRTNLHAELLSAVEPALFEIVLESTGQNRLAAANMLGIHRATLRKKLTGEG